MKGKVAKKFRCLVHGKIYHYGDIYEDTPARLQKLQGLKYVEIIAEPKPIELPPEPEEALPEPVHIGGGYYLLPDGTKVRGKEEAFKALGGE